MAKKRILKHYTISLTLLLGLPAILAGCAAGTRRPPTPTPIPLFTAVPASGQQVFYVAPGGSDMNPGTQEQPWGTLQHAAEVLRPGDTVFIRAGRYALARQVRPKNSGSEDAWITYAGYPGEQAVLDANAMDTFPQASAPPYPRDNGAFQIEKVAYIRVQNLAVVNSHNAGFTIRDSHHIELINNRTDKTFSSGIAAWDTNHDDQDTHQIKIIGNTITKATTWEMIPKGMRREGEPPHEAISIAGAIDFEVAYNHIYNSDKEGIDVKETSKHGKVHHNLVHDVDRQGIYVDSWFGEINDIEIYENVVHHCRGAGLVISVENGKLVDGVHAHHNLIFENQGSGIFFSRWGDGPRRNISITNNTVVHNGYGTPNPGDEYFWLTGGLYFYSANLENILIRDNIFSENRAFQIGYSDHYLVDGTEAEEAFRRKNIRIEYNLVFARDQVEYPIWVGWPPDDYANVYALAGSHAVLEDPLFVDPFQSNYTLQEGSPAVNQGSPDGENNDPDGTRGDLGAYPLGVSEAFWWKGEFPPQEDPISVP